MHLNSQQSLLKIKHLETLYHDLTMASTKKEKRLVLFKQQPPNQFEQSSLNALTVKSLRNNTSFFCRPLNWSSIIIAGFFLLRLQSNETKNLPIAPFIQPIAENFNDDKNFVKSKAVSVASDLKVILTKTNLKKVLVLEKQNVISAKYDLSFMQFLKNCEQKKTRLPYGSISSSVYQPGNRNISKPQNVLNHLKNCPKKILEGCRLFYRLQLTNVIFFDLKDYKVITENQTNVLTHRLALPFGFGSACESQVGAKLILTNNDQGVFRPMTSLIELQPSFSSKFLISTPCLIIKSRPFYGSFILLKNPNQSLIKWLEFRPAANIDTGQPAWRLGLNSNTFGIYTNFDVFFKQKQKFIQKNDRGCSAYAKIINPISSQELASHTLEASSNNQLTSPNSLSNNNQLLFRNSLTVENMASRELNLKDLKKLKPIMQIKEKNKQQYVSLGVSALVGALLITTSARLSVNNKDLKQILYLSGVCVIGFGLLTNSDIIMYTANICGDAINKKVSQPLLNNLLYKGEELIAHPFSQILLYTHIYNTLRKSELLKDLNKLKIFAQSLRSFESDGDDWFGFQITPTNFPLDPDTNFTANFHDVPQIKEMIFSSSQLCKPAVSVFVQRIYPQIKKIPVKKMTNSGLVKKF